MSPVAVELPLPEPSAEEKSYSRFSDLRGVRWRINLGILPSLPTASIEDHRRVAADSRRKYASLRRRLLIDPHLPKDGNKSPDLAMDNPLSQNPDSTWGRFFRNAELERMVDQDLSRLYPEHGSYFQTMACQAMLRRLLLVWCVRHPEYGYRQGMHELLAPLLYVLHVDLQHLSEVRALYEDHFNDEFDDISFPDSDQVSNYRFTKSSTRDAITDKDNNFPEEGTPKVTNVDDLDPETKDLFLLSDAYGAEGELGVILSERFMEHDAYCMFDGLMSGARGLVAMADFFSPAPSVGSSTGLPPVIEASSALYHLLSIVDSSLHSHLIDLGVEPQYFALRWLRVLFGREFSLDDLLLIWDELFSSPNSSSIETETEYNFKILCSPRGAFISAMAVSMLLHLRSSLLATENATSCLQRLLNFPKNIDVKKLIEKAKSWQALALETNISSSPSQNDMKLEVGRTLSLPISSSSSKTADRLLPESYWEEKWRVLHKEEVVRKNSGSKSNGKIKALLGEKLGLSRLESVPPRGKKDARSSSARRRLLDDLVDTNSKLECDRGTADENNSKSSSARHQLLDDLADADNKFDCEGVPISDENNVKSSSARRQLLDDLADADSKLDCDGVPLSSEKVSFPLDVDVGKVSLADSADQNVMGRASDSTVEETCLSGETSSVFSTANSAHSMGNDHDNDSEKSSVTSNSFIADNDEETNQDEENVDTEAANTASVKDFRPGKDGEVKQIVGLKDRKPLSGKFQWFMRLGKGSGEGNSQKGSLNAGNVCKETSGSGALESNSNGDSGRMEVGDKKVMGTMKNLGQSMLDNIQVIESVFQQDRGKGQATALAALKELRKISNILSEM